MASVDRVWCKRECEPKDFSLTTSTSSHKPAIRPASFLRILLGAMAGTAIGFVLVVYGAGFPIGPMLLIFLLLSVSGAVSAAAIPIRAAPVAPTHSAPSVVRPPRRLSPDLTPPPAGLYGDEPPEEARVEETVMPVHSKVLWAVFVCMLPVTALFVLLWGMGAGIR